MIVAPRFRGGDIVSTTRTTGEARRYLKIYVPVRSSWRAGSLQLGRT